MQTAAILKMKKVISRMSNFDNILHGGVGFGFGLQTLGDLEKMVKMKIWNKILAIKQQIFMVKTF